MLYWGVDGLKILVDIIKSNTFYILMDLSLIAAMRFFVVTGTPYEMQTSHTTLIILFSDFSYILALYFSDLSIFDFSKQFCETMYAIFKT